MTLDQAVALSLLDNLPRTSLTARLKGGDPELLEVASQLEGLAFQTRAAAADAGIHVLAWNDVRMPPLLLAIPDCPPALWFQGSLDALAAPAVAIVGSRAASPVALETAARLGADLAERGIVVISGLARGVDSAAHRGALTRGRTIAVLGSGIDRIYPPEHETLAREIAREGLVVSEYAPGALPLPYRFPLRNRLISGLARAVVVIEASDKSGSLITAACALEQGRDVMAVPGNVLSGRNRGGHALIRDGAKIVECADDIVVELGVPAHAAEPPANAVSDEKSDNCGDSLLRGMASGQPYDLDALTRLTGCGAAQLLPELAALELRGLIRRAGGGRFLRLERTC